MPKTVTVKDAPPGVVTVRCNGRDFPVGEAVHDVDDDTIDALKATSGVSVHVATKRKADQEDK